MQERRCRRGGVGGKECGRGGGVGGKECWRRGLWELGNECGRGGCVGVKRINSKLTSLLGFQEAFVQLEYFTNHKPTRLTTRTQVQSADTHACLGKQLKLVYVQRVK